MREGHLGEGEFIIDMCTSFLHKHNTLHTLNPHLLMCHVCQVHLSDDNTKSLALSSFFLSLGALSRSSNSADRFFAPAGVTVC